MSRICFQIVPPIDRPETPVLITGNHPALGEWNHLKALKLEWQAPYKVGGFEAETSFHLEYKITRGNSDCEAVDAYGHVPSSFAHCVDGAATLQHTVADWKDRLAGSLANERIVSRVLGENRDLMVWLPPSYTKDQFHRFPLIILHDGDHIFDPSTSIGSGVDWAADEWVNLLARQGVIPESIVVAVRHPEGVAEANMSRRDFDLSPEHGGAAYAQFIATELVPYLDAHYRTIPRAESRILGGAALGGLHTFYTALNHPGVFSKFLCLSTSFEDVSQSLPNNSAQLLALENCQELPPNIRIFFDYGDQGLDECYEGYHAFLGSLLREKGWTDGKEFTIQRIPGGAHNDLSWRSRLGNAIRFVVR
jgi:enterochelin esterase-like enzyme